MNSTKPSHVLEVEHDQIVVEPLALIQAFEVIEVNSSSISTNSWIDQWPTAVVSKDDVTIEAWKGLKKRYRVHLTPSPTVSENFKGLRGSALYFHDLALE